MSLGNGEATVACNNMMYVIRLLVGLGVFSNSPGTTYCYEDLLVIESTGARTVD